MPKCYKCGADLTDKGFDHDLNLCYECLQKEVAVMQQSLYQGPLYLIDKRREHADILTWMLGVVAEHYGYAEV